MLLKAGLIPAEQGGPTASRMCRGACRSPRSQGAGGLPATRRRAVCTPRLGGWPDASRCTGFALCPRCDHQHELKVRRADGKVSPLNYWAQVITSE